MLDKNLKKDRFFIITVISAICYAVFFSLACIAKYRAYSYYDFDLALHAQKCWNILNGSPYSSILGLSIWGNALEIITFLLASNEGLE